MHLRVSEMMLRPELGMREIFTWSHFASRFHSVSYRYKHQITNFDRWLLGRYRWLVRTGHGGGRSAGARRREGVPVFMGESTLGGSLFFFFLPVWILNTRHPPLSFGSFQPLKQWWCCSSTCCYKLTKHWRRDRWLLGVSNGDSKVSVSQTLQFQKDDWFCYVLLSTTISGFWSCRSLAPNILVCWSRRLWSNAYFYMARDLDGEFFGINISGWWSGSHGFLPSIRQIRQHFSNGKTNQQPV